MSTFTNPSGISSGSNDAFSTDMFGRLKIAEGFTLFDSQHRYKDSGDYSDTTANSGSVSYNANESSALLTVAATTTNSEVTRESRRVFPYQPGKSLQVLQTFVMAPAHANLRQRVGYFSRQNGFYLEQDGTTINFVKRTYIDGSVDEIRIPQSDWNVDKLDGTGPSLFSLDLSKAQILFTEYEWLGVGSVRMGFAINGIFVIAHQFNHANILDTVYITTATLPVRYEIKATGSLPTTATMKQICATVISNGGYDRKTEMWTAARTTAIEAETTAVPVAGIRLASGRTDAVIIPAALSIMPLAQDKYQWLLIKNPSSLNGDWTTHSDSGSNTQYNINATTVSGGTVVAEGFLSADNQSVTSLDDSNIARFEFQLGRTNADTPTSDVYVLACRVLSGNGNNVVGSISWYDLV